MGACARTPTSPGLLAVHGRLGAEEVLSFPYLGPMFTARCTKLAVLGKLGNPIHLDHFEVGPPVLRGLLPAPL